MKRELSPERCVGGYGHARGSARPPGALAWAAAGAGMLLFAFAGTALMGELVTEEQFWLLSSAGLASYVCAHCLISHEASCLRHGLEE